MLCFETVRSELLGWYADALLASLRDCRVLVELVLSRVGGRRHENHGAAVSVVLLPLLLLFGEPGTECCHSLGLRCSCSTSFVSSLVGEDEINNTRVTRRAG